MKVPALELPRVLEPGHEHQAFQSLALGLRSSEVQTVRSMASPCAVQTSVDWRLMVLACSLGLRVGFKVLVLGLELSDEESNPKKLCFQQKQGEVAYNHHHRHDAAGDALS